MKRYLMGSVLAVALAGAGAAQQAPLAEVGLQKRIDFLSEDFADHGFELGLLSALRGIERTLQTRYEHGMGDRLRAVPMLRLDLGVRNPSPKPVQPDTLKELMKRVLVDLAFARVHLIGDRERGEIHPFELTLQDVWFDINSNGQRETGEDALAALAPVLMGRRALGDIRESGVMEQPLTIRFDEADHAWLMAYTHMLSGAGTLFLAFDPTPVLQDLADQRAALANAPRIPNTFDPAALALEITALEQELEMLEAKIVRLRGREKTLKQVLQSLRDTTPRDDADISVRNERLKGVRAEIRPLRAQTRNIRAEIAAATAKLGGETRNPFEGFRNDIDTIYVLLAALRQQPKPDLIAATRAHWLEMIAQNKVFWAKLSQETDNDREWIPNPVQTSALPVEVSADMADGWQAILEDTEALLEGRLLIPHPLLPSGTGISLKAYAETPGSLDLLEWFHGIGAYRYAAKGPTITRQRWLAFQRLTRGNAGGFAVFFN